MFNLIQATPYMNCKYGRALESIASPPVADSTLIVRRWHGTDLWGILYLAINGQEFTVKN